MASYSQSSDMNISLNKLWREQFHITQLEETLEKLQSQRQSKYGNRMEQLQTQLNQMITDARNKNNQSNQIEAEVPKLMQHVDELNASIKQLDQHINTQSRACNEMRCVDPERIQGERLLRLAMEDLNESSQEKKEWEVKLSKARNKRNRKISSSFHEAQTISNEIENARSLCLDAKENRRLALEKTLKKEDRATNQLDHLIKRNEELQLEYEAQLKEEEVLRRKMGRMDDFVQQNDAIRSLLSG